MRTHSSALFDMCCCVCNGPSGGHHCSRPAGHAHTQPTKMYGMFSHMRTIARASKHKRGRHHPSSRNRAPISEINFSKSIKHRRGDQTPHAHRTLAHIICEQFEMVITYTSMAWCADAARGHTTRRTSVEKVLRISCVQTRLRVKASAENSHLTRHARARYSRLYSWRLIV